MNKSVLIIEDEKRIAHWVKRYFERADFYATVAHDGLTGLDLARREQPDIIILDLMLPGMDGMEVCRLLRRESDVPIIMLTARGTHTDRIDGLERGADDYVVKPFDPEEVVARARAVLRRVGGSVQTVLRAGALQLDESSHTLHLNEKAVSLSPIQFTLLATFMRHANQVLSREQLLNAAFSHDFEGFDRTIDTHIRRLRRKIQANPNEPQYIQTVYGVGYKFVAPKDEE
jgi:DNA-binding response OmpR family regulator